MTPGDPSPACTTIGGRVGAVTVLRAITYLRTAAAVAWRAITGRPCACEFCRAHRQFVRDSANLYRAEVRGLVAGHERRAL